MQSCLTASEIPTSSRLVSRRQQCRPWRKTKLPPCQHWLFGLPNGMADG
jgi:hypothetical protein